MIKVKDLSGNEVTGVYRTENGALVVNNEVELNRYKQQVADKQRIAAMETELSDIKELLKQLLNDKNRS